MEGERPREPRQGKPLMATIPSAAVRVRYAVAATPDKTWLSPADFDGLFDAIPAEIQASPAAAGWENYRAYGNAWSGAKRLFMSRTAP